MFLIEFTVTNAAMRDDDDRLDPQAVAEAVAEIADEIRHGATGDVIRDVNGNRIGTWSLTDDD